MVVWKADIVLRNLNLLTVGAPYSLLSSTDVPTVKMRDKVLIPGTSFKGVLRTSAHMAAASVGMSSCGEIDPSKISEAHKNGVCDVCDVFGMPGTPVTACSKVRVSDLKPSRLVRTFPLTRTSMNPARGKVEEGRLFTMEVVPLYTEFEGEVWAMGEKALKLVLAALDELRYGVLGKGSLVDLRVRSIKPEPDSLDEVGRRLLDGLAKWRWEDVCGPSVED